MGRTKGGFNRRKSVLCKYGNIMTSILTNNGAMTALQTLKSINRDLSGVQEQISSGKKVGTAKDNAATWAISKVMEADVTGFKKISEGLSVAESTVAVARDASETVVSLLNQVKGKIVQAQDEAQDKGKIQADITALVEQVNSVVGAAQFNGVNLIQGGGANVEVLSSLNRDAGGTVTPGKIQVVRQDLSTTGTAVPASWGTSVTAGDQTVIDDGTGTGTANVVATGTTQNVDIASVGDGFGFRIAFDGSASGSPTHTFEFIANASDSTTSVAEALTTQMNTFISANGLTGRFSVNRVGDQLQIGNTSGADLGITVDASTDSTAASGGGLSLLAGIDVESDASGALSAIDGLIDTATSAAAAFGTTQNQLSTQNDFVGKLMDSMKAGIGSMVDADMEEASARLQALQTQQQLGIQSLSIANQAPGAVMALFR